jgi:hypothetical protein
MTVPFREFDVDNFDNIQNQLVPYIIKTYPNKITFWNHVDQEQLFEHVPELLTAVKHIAGQRPLKTYLLAIPNAPEVLLATQLGPKSLHRDTSVESCRLNWPVINSNSIETRLFSSTAEPSKLVLPTGETYLTYQEQDCELIDSFLMTKPTALHVHTIHGLYRATGPLPRYVLSFNFDQDISHLL